MSLLLIIDSYGFVRRYRTQMTSVHRIRQPQEPLRMCIRYLDMYSISLQSKYVHVIHHLPCIIHQPRFLLESSLHFKPLR
jgi:hypothetical protein